MKAGFLLIWSGIFWVWNICAVDAGPNNEPAALIMCENSSYNLLVVYDEYTEHIIVLEQGIIRSAPTTPAQHEDNRYLSGSYIVSAHLLVDITLIIPASIKIRGSFFAALTAEKFDFSGEGPTVSPVLTLMLNCYSVTLESLEKELLFLLLHEQTVE